MIEILNRYTNAVQYKADVSSVREAVQQAVREGANLRGANLGGAYLGDANLGGAYLRGAYLGDANLGGAYLRGAYLGDANLRGANLGGAYLRGAYLGDAYLGDANLGGAYLGGAYLEGAKGLNKYLVTPLLMLLDQPDPIRAYKLVNEAGEGPQYGGLTYEISETYEVSKASTDEHLQCGPGINLATLDWCIKNWREGFRIFVAEFRREDIACIPTATDGKFRVFRCSVVAEKDLAEIGLVETEDVSASA